MINTGKIGRYVEIGWRDKLWYQDCQDTFERLFGPDNLELVCKIFAATSINTSLKSNITLFRRAYYEILNSLPVGHYLPNIQMQLAKIRNGEPLSGRKISSFAAAMSGDVNAVVVDIWLLRAFQVDNRYMRNTGPHKGLERSGGATNRQYTIIEAWVRDEAPRLGLEPRELSSIIWAGVRIDQTGSLQTHYKEILINNFTNLFNCI